MTEKVTNVKSCNCNRQISNTNFQNSQLALPNQTAGITLNISINGSTLISNFPCSSTEATVIANIGDTIKASVSGGSGITLTSFLWSTPGNSMCIDFESPSGATINSTNFKIIDCLSTLPAGLTLLVEVTAQDGTTYNCYCQFLQAPMFDITVTEPDGSTTTYSDVTCSGATIQVNGSDMVEVFAHPTFDLPIVWSATPYNCAGYALGPGSPNFSFLVTAGHSFSCTQSSILLTYTETFNPVGNTNTGTVGVTCNISFQIGKSLIPISIAVSENGQTFPYSSCCSSICVVQNSDIILTGNIIIANPIYQWFMCNAPILIGGTGQTYQPSTSTIGSITYTVVFGQSGSTVSDPLSTLFCSITINTVAPIDISINAMINCSGQSLACGSTLNVCQGDIVSLSVLPSSDCNNSYIYQWSSGSTSFANTQSITICNDPGTYTYYALVSYCCNIGINAICSITLVVSPKVTIVPIRNGTSVTFTCGDEINVDQCDKLYLLAQTSEKVSIVWLHNNKIVSTEALLEVKTKHVGKFDYVVQLVSEESSIICSPCATCSAVVNVKKRHKHR